MLTALLSTREPSLLSFLAARQFLISHNDGMSPTSVQFISSLDFLHTMSSSLNVFFKHSLLSQSDEEAGVQVRVRLHSQPSEHPSACVDKKDECSQSIQGQSKRNLLIC